MDEIIRIKNLKKSFGNNKILKSISLTLEKGQNMAILGKSGSGKTVLIKSIIGLIPVDSGSIMVYDKNIPELNNDELEEIRKKVGYLFQGGALYDSMSVRENLEFPVRRTQLSKNKHELNDMVEEALSYVDLLDSIDKMPSELSGGMKKRVGLARTLILKPEIILYDEPTTGLDPVTSGEISELILQVQETYNTSSIIITHDMKCVRMTANHIKLLSKGIFKAEGSFEDLAESNDDEVRAFFT